jgi:hypothetical protein
MLFFDDLLPEEKDSYNQEFIMQLHRISSPDCKILPFTTLDLSKAPSIAKVRQRFLKYIQEHSAKNIFFALQQVEQEAKTRNKLQRPKMPSNKNT